MIKLDFKSLMDDPESQPFLPFLHLREIDTDAPEEMAAARRGCEI